MQWLRKLRYRLSRSLQPPTFALHKRISLILWMRRLTAILIFPGQVLLWLYLVGSSWLSWLCLLLGFFILISLQIALGSWLDSLRRQFIRDSEFPAQLKAKLHKKYSQITPAQAELVVHGLRQFFMANARSNARYVAMPSRAVDTAWHEFILNTRVYGQWCNTAFGSLLHHTPASAMGASAKRNDGLRRAWYWTCKEESIDPGNPTRLPLLFALDKKLDIKNGFSYVPDCKTVARALDGHGASYGTESHCGTSFSDGSHSSNSSSSDSFGGADGSFDSSSDSGGSSDGGGGGDGGGGCGGGGD